MQISLSKVGTGLFRATRENFLWFSLLVVGVVSLLTTEQVASGWIALGERINISRRDFNMFEIAVLIISVLWGILALWMTWHVLKNQDSLKVNAYFDGTMARMTAGTFFAFAAFSMVSIVLIIIVEQVATGWLALGERANISRRNLNRDEWLVMIGAGTWALVNLRTALGFWLVEKPARAWGEWICLINAFIGALLLLEGAINVDAAVALGGSASEDFAGALWEIAPGLVLFLSSFAVYLILVAEVHTSADQTVRNILAKSPAAGAIVGFVVLYLVFWITSDLFLTTRSQAGIFTNNATSGIVAIGITMLMISGEFDLSIGSIYGASALVFLLMMTEGAFGIEPQPVIVALIVGLGFGTFLGMINGLLKIQTGIPSFIVTLGTMLAYRAIPLVVIEEGKILRYADYRKPEPVIYFNRWVIIAGALILAAAIIALAVPYILGFGRNLIRRLKTYVTDTNDFKFFFLVLALLQLVLVLALTFGLVALLVWAASNQYEHRDGLLAVNFFELASGQIRELPLLGTVPIGANLQTGVIWWLLLVIIFQFILTRTPYGNAVFAVGGNPGAARAQGVNVNGIKLLNFMLAGGLAAFAGVLNVSRVTSVNANLGQGLELDVIAASVIGGTLLSGGYGSIFGALLGILIAGMVQTGLVLIGVDPRLINGVNGIIIIIAVIINTTVRQQKR